MIERLPGSPALTSLHELQDRWAQVLDWVHRSTSQVYEYRMLLNNESMLVNDGKLRSRARETAQQRFEARLAEIDETELCFKRAHDDIVSTLDHDALIDRAVSILPMLREMASLEGVEKKARDLKRRLDKSKSRLPQSMMVGACPDERVTGVTRGEGAGEEGNDGIRELPQADRPQEAPDA